MPHQYYIQDFKQRMHLTLAGGGQANTYSGVIICPSHAELHKKMITVRSGQETASSVPYKEFTIDGIEQVFTSGAQIQAVFDLELVDPESVDWVL